LLAAAPNKLEPAAGCAVDAAPKRPVPVLGCVEAPKRPVVDAMPPAVPGFVLVEGALVDPKSPPVEAAGCVAAGLRT
jgi:hypothetical protein